MLALANLCDYLRIDHFRAFDTYYVIPAGEETARNGVWKIGPRDDFFNELYKKYPNINLIAEDLGDLRPEVDSLSGDGKGRYLSRTGTCLFQDGSLL